MTGLATHATSVQTSDRLAVDGGEPIVKRGFVLRSVWPRITDDVVSRVTAQLRSGLLTELVALRTVF